MSELSSEKNKEKSLLSIYVPGFIFSCLALILCVFEYVDSPFYLLIPIIPVVYIVFRIIRTKNKIERDVIKSLNDSILFSISFLTTCTLTFKTVDYLNYDIFNELMKKNTGYYLISIYAILFSIKALISICEAIENNKALKESLKPKP
ncbi:TPA: hypothetical protein ACNFP5_004867 [Enterobacter ludwigii]